MPTGDDSSGDKKDSAIAKGVAFMVFSGIALSVLKSLSPFNRRRNETEPLTPTESTQPILDTPLPPPLQPITSKLNRTEAQPLPLTECTQLTPYIPPPLPLEPIITQKPNADQNVPESSHKMVEIVRGDTLWGLSRKYGVSIDEIKEANGLAGDTIHVGKKLIIP